MTRIRDIKTTFTAGEVSRDLLGRGDLRAYDNGALTLRNVFINPTGGVTRRSGLGYIDTAAGDGKVIAFEFNTQQTALLVITDEQIDIYSGGVKEVTLSAPWTTVQIQQLAWTQSADTLLLTHPDVPPKKLVRSIGGVWTLSDWSFFSDNNIIFQPFFKFAASDMTLTPSAVSGDITLTASADIFEAGHEGTRLRVRGIDIDITDFDSPTVVSGTVIPKPNPDYDAEDVSSEEFLYLPDTGDPLTPVSVQIRRQTRTGSRIDRYIPPVNVDGATLYCARSGQELYEFLYTDLEQAYASTDLALLSRNIIGTPIDQDYDQKNRLLFVVREDGKFATLTVFRAEKVSAWTLHETSGLVKSVAVVGDEVYMLVLRDGDYFIEQFDVALNLDPALSGQVGSPATVWSGLDHLEDQEVSIVADGVVIPDQTVLGGSVTLSEPASDVQIGLAYTHIIEPLPPNEAGKVGAGRNYDWLKRSSALRIPRLCGLMSGEG